MIYLDNAATTKPSETTLATYNKINAEEYYNPSASYSCAFSLSGKINEGRRDLINLLHGDENGSIIFTSGATESNNLAIFGSSSQKQKTYLFSMGEHPSVYNCAKELLNRGYRVDFIKLDRAGKVDLDDLKRKMTADVCFVSVMFVSNETGAINDLKKVREIIDDVNKNCLLHVDGVQGFGKIKINLLDNKIDLFSMSAHKIGGIKGVGALYVSSRARIKNIVFGGGQENNLRPGTVNGAGILSFVETAKECYKNMDKNYDFAQNLKQKLLTGLQNLNLNKLKIVSEESASPYVVSVLFEGNRGETLMRFLDSQGVLISTGSACSSSKVGNRILESMGYTKPQVMGAIRVSFWTENTADDVVTLVQNIKKYMAEINA